jgi:hypothetical protein
MTSSSFSQRRIWQWGVGVVILVLAIFLRFYHLDSVPPSPYWEEAALGYDAYSIAQTGRDHHGQWLPLVAFESFGDWKPGGYIYAAGPFIKVWGLSVWGIRLPAAISGVLIVLGVGELSRVVLRSQLNIKTKAKTKLSPLMEWTPLLSMALASVSPWLIQFSRAAWEVNLATCLILWGVILGLKVVTAQTSNRWILVGSAVLLVLSIYTYHAARIVAPGLGVGLLGLWVVNHSGITAFFQKQWRLAIVTGGVALALLLPFIQSLGSSTTSQRFAETSIFYNLDVIVESNQRVEAAGGTLLSRLLYHRYLLFGREVLVNFLSHLRLDFLFLNGDSNARHSIQFMGQLYHIEALFVLLGLYVLIRNWNRVHAFLSFWIVLAILPASITLGAPHALRILLMVPVLMCIMSWGLVETILLVENLFQKLPRGLGRKLSQPIFYTGIALTLIAIYVVELLMFWRYYTLIYPKLFASDWQYGYQQMVSQVATYRQQHPDIPIVITREYGRPAMYYWFYTQTDPQLVQTANATVAKDQGEFLAFENITFVRGAAEVPLQPSLVVASPAGIDQLKLRFPTSSMEVITFVNDPLGKDVWEIVRLD